MMLTLLLPSTIANFKNEHVLVENTPLESKNTGLVVERLKQYVV